MDAQRTATACEILLVEDNPINQKVVKLMLGRFKIDPVIVDSGNEAIEAAGRQRFNLILMDLHMPGMDGVEASMKIRERLGENCPPIVALTADVVAESHESFQRAGMNGFLTKPITSDTLRNCIQEHTHVLLPA